MRRLGRLGIVALAALLALGTVGLPTIGAAPVGYSSTALGGWSTNGPVRAVLIVGDTVYAGGDFTTVTSPNGAQTLTRGRLAAWDIRTGLIRTGFVADTNGRVESLATDGTRLFVGGDYTTIKGVNRARLASLNLTTGAVNTGFSAGATSHVYALRVKGNRLYVGGAFSTLAGQPRSRIGAVDTTTGALDPTFNPNASDAVHAIQVSPDGNTVYVGGDFLTIGGGARGWIAPVNSVNGLLLPLTFQYPLVQTSVPYLIDLDLSPDGSQLFAGLGGFENQAVSWSTTTGRRQWGRQVNGDLQAVKYSQGNVYMGFHEGDLGDDTVRMLTADAVTGIVEAPYHLTMNSFYGVWDIDASPDAVVLGGEFTNVNGVGVQGVAILPRVSTETVPPTAPTGLRVAGTTANSVSLAWNPGTDNTGVVGYRILRGGIEIAYSATTTFTENDLPAASDFSYEVQSVDASGNFSPKVGPIPAGTDQTLVPMGSTWRYLDNGSNQGTAWRAGAFNDTPWASGPAQLGYGDGDEATVVSFGADANNKPYTTYFRRQFTVPNPGALANVNLTMLRDDGAVVYLNNVEVARSNMPTGTISNTTAATTNVDGAAESQLFGFTVPTARFVAGVNTLAVEVHQNYRSSSDISFDLSLSTARQLAPAPPPNFRSTAVTGTSAALAWDAPTGTITGYRVYRNGVLVGSPAVTTFADPGLTSATAYSYTATAVNSGGLESAPTAPLVITTPDVIAPSVPTGLTASTISATRVVLEWAAATDNVAVTGYDLLRNGTLIASPTGTTYTDTDVTGGQSYSYTLRARDLANNVSAASVALPVATPNAADITPPSVPPNLRTVTKSTTQLTIAWDAASDNVGVTGYVVSRNGVDLPVTTLTTLTDTLLAPGATYTYTVRALDAALNISPATGALAVTTHTPVETAFAAGSVWKYTDDGVSLGTAWKESAYDDSTWKSGAGQLGYGDGDEITLMNQGGAVPDLRFISHYLRRNVTISDASELNRVTLSVLRDDGVVVYVNGVEALRDNMPAGTITNATFASSAVVDAAESTYYDFEIPPSMFQSGNNVIAVEVHNESRQGLGDLSFDARLTTRYGPLEVAAPTNLRSTGSTASSVDLAWDAPFGPITGYRVFRGGVLVGSPTGTTFTDPGVASAQTYSYTVTALIASAESAPSASISVTTPDGVAPSVPTGLATSTVTSTSVALSWSPATDNVGVTGYDVLRDGNLIGSPATAAFTDPGVLEGQSYSYTVRARDLAGNVSAESAALPVSTPGPDITAPTVPNNLRTTDVTQTQVSLAWDASTDAVGVTAYDVLRDGNVIGSPTGSTFVDPGLVAGQTYSYTVRARDLRDNTSAESTPLPVTTVPPDTTAPSIPANLRTTGVTQTQVNLAWDAATDAFGVTGYDVLRDGNVIGSPTGTTFADSTVVGGVTYSYTVRAHDLAGNSSADSVALPVTPPAPDTTAPSVPANLRTATLTPAQVVLAWNAATDAFGVTGYEVRRNGVLIGSPTTTTLTDNAVAANQTYSYTVRARDLAGNWSADSTALVVTTPGDILAPVTTDNSAATGNAWRRTAATVTLSATDNMSGVARTYYTTDGSVPTTASAFGNTISLTTSGTYTIRYFSVDVAGNTEAVKTAGTQIRIDTTLPTAAFTFPVSGSSFNAARWNAGCATARICGTAVDPLSGLASVGVTIQRSSDNRFWSGTTWQVASSTRPATGTASWFVALATSALTNGVTYTVTARSVDVAGNTSNPVVSTFTYDTTAPATQSIAANNHSGQVQTTVDTFSATFAEALNPATVPTTATLTLSRSNGTTSYSISGLTNGLVSTGGNGYLTSSGTTRTITFTGSVVLSNSNRTVTFTVTGACGGTCTARSTTAVNGRFVYTPATTLQDLAGNNATGTITATANQPMF